MRRCYAEGQASYPQLGLSYADFALRAPEGHTPRHPADYFLARACDVAVAGAWEQIQLRFEGPLKGFLRARGARSEEAQQLTDEVWGALAARPPRGGADTRIGTYDGRGSLRSWLATIVWRRLTDRWRARRQAGEPLVEERDVSDTGRDPASKAAREESAGLVGSALEAAWSSLTTRELQAIVLKYRYRLPQTEIARLLGIGAPRVTRLLDAATQRLRQAIEARCSEHAAWQAGDAGWQSLQSALDRVLSQSAATLDGPHAPEDSDG